MLLVEIKASPKKVASRGLLFSKTFGAGVGGGVSTKKASAASTALGASGNSFAAEIPVRTTTANAESKNDFMSASPLIGIDCERPCFRFAFAPVCFDSVMSRDYVGTCTAAMARP